MLVGIHLTLLVFLSWASSIFRLIKHTLPFLLADVSCVGVFNRIINDLYFVQELILLITSSGCLVITCICCTAHSNGFSFPTEIVTIVNDIISRFVGMSLRRHFWKSLLIATRWRYSSARCSIFHIASIVAQIVILKLSIAKEHCSRVFGIDWLIWVCNDAERTTRALLVRSLVSLRRWQLLVDPSLGWINLENATSCRCRIWGRQGSFTLLQLKNSGCHVWMQLPLICLLLD